MKINIILFFIIVLLIGCNNLKTGIPINKPCLELYPQEAPEEWEIICAKYPYAENTKIPKDVEEALVKVNFLCPGYPYPTAEKVNRECKALEE